MLSSVSLAGFPSNKMLPEVGFNKPVIKFSKVVLPHPLGPTNEINSFFDNLNETFFREAVSQDIV